MGCEDQEDDQTEAICISDRIGQMTLASEDAESGRRSSPLEFETTLASEGAESGPKSLPIEIVQDIGRRCAK